MRPSSHDGRYLVYFYYPEISDSTSPTLNRSPSCSAEGECDLSYDSKYRNSYSYEMSSQKTWQWNYQAAAYTKTKPMYYGREGAPAGGEPWLTMNSTSASYYKPGSLANTQYDWKYHNSYSYNSKANAGGVQYYNSLGFEVPSSYSSTGHSMIGTEMGVEILVGDREW